MIVRQPSIRSEMPTTAGSLALADFYPETMPFIIQKLEAAGALS